MKQKSMKRVLSILLAVVMTVTVANGLYMPIVKAASSFASSIQSAASSSIGKKSSELGFPSGQNWCGYYVRYILDQAYTASGVSASNYVPYSSLTSATQTAKSWSTGGYGDFFSWTSWSYNGINMSPTSNTASCVPKVGDVILVETGSSVSDGPDHLGIIVQVNSDGSFKTAEGNTGSGTVSTRVVQYQNYIYDSSQGKYRRSTWSSGIVHAVCSVRYPSNDSDSGNSISYTSTNLPFRVTTEGGVLYMRSGPGSGYNQVGKISNGTDITVTRVTDPTNFKNGWGYTTYGGVSGWISLAWCGLRGSTFGDFYGYIIKKDAWVHLENSASNNVQIRSGTSNDSFDPRQIWHFLQQSDGSYKIVSCYNDRVLDADNVQTANGTNVLTWTDSGATNQRWYFVPSPDNDGYYIKSAYCDKVVDCNGNSSSGGTNVQLWESNGGSAQKFEIWNITKDGRTYSKPSKPSKPSITVPSSITLNKEFTISWTASKLVNEFDSRSYQVNVFDANGKKLVDYTTSNTSDQFKVVDSGTYYIQVTAINTRYPDWSTASNKVSFTATNSNTPVTGVVLNKSSLTLDIGKTETLTATVSPSNATNKAVTWSSSDTSVATVDSSGKVTAKKAGSATITVKTSDGSKTATCKVTVPTSSVSVTGVALNKSSLALEVGKSETLTATVSPSNATNKAVTWSSSDTSVATVDSSGKVTAKKKGSATITVKTVDGSKSSSCLVTVSMPYITLSETNITLTSGEDAVLWN